MIWLGGRSGDRIIHTKECWCGSFTLHFGMPFEYWECYRRDVIARLSLHEALQVNELYLYSPHVFYLLYHVSLNTVC